MKINEFISARLEGQRRQSASPSSRIRTPRFAGRNYEAKTNPPLWFPLSSLDSVPILSKSLSMFQSVFGRFKVKAGQIESSQSSTEFTLHLKFLMMNQLHVKQHQLESRPVKVSQTWSNRQARRNMPCSDFKWTGPAAHS